ncbi:MAG TPA: tetratricopeptide repeat protein [Kofleriaceae bacterium]|nr:tetratricopeptide repeat protein [Kofleriaceae bacterium]
MHRIVLLACALLPALAHADRVTKPPVVELSERVKPVAQDKAPPPKPVATPDSIMDSQLAAVPYREEQVDLLKKLIKSTPDSAADEKADYYFRLGELYASQQRVYRLQSARAEIAGDKAAAKAAADKAHSFMIGAVSTYKDLTDNDSFRNFPKMDLALFYYAYTLQSGKYVKEARSVFDKLLKNYPSSKYVPEAHLAFADYYFESGQLADAEARYKRVLEFPSSNAYWYAMYKLGWIDLNLAKHQDALEVFYKVANATKANAKYEVLNRAAKKDFVRAYAEIGKADKAFDAFKRVDTKAAFGMLETLADFYLGQGKSDRAIYVLRELMKLQPTSPRVCTWQYEVAHATLALSGATNADKVKEIVDLDRVYLAVAGKLPKGDADECRDNASAMAGELARAYHSEWTKTKSVDSFSASEKLYKAYLATFPKASDFPATHYYFAELLWSRAETEKDARLQTQLWENAGVEFTDVVKAGGLDAVLSKEAAYAAVLAFLYAHDRDPRSAAPAKAGEIPERDQKMLAAFDLYFATVKDAKNDDELVRIKFTKGNVLRRYARFDQAIPIFRDIVAKYPTHDLAEDAANLWLDSLNQKHDEVGLVAAARELLANGKFLDDKPKAKEVAEDIELTALRKIAEKLEKEARATKDPAKLVECGNAYLAIYNRNPEAKKNDEVLYNAGVCYEDGHSIGVAIRMYGLLEQYYPQSPVLPRAIARLGKAYGDIAFYDRAADRLEQYAKKFAAEEDAHDAMNDAVLYRKGTGDDAKAIEDTKFFVRTFGKSNPAEVANAAFALTSVYEKKGDHEAVIKHLREYIRVHGDKGGADKVVIAHARIGELLFEDSCPVKTVDDACVKITRERAVATRGRLARLPTQCGPDTKIKLTLVPRDERKVRDALAELATAAKHATKATTGDTAGVRYHLALARMIEANVEYEKYLGLAFPQNLDFDPKNKAVRDKSLARFDAWFAAKAKAGEAVSKKYVSVLELNDSANSIAARARLAQIAQNFSDALFTAEIPKDVRSGSYAEDKIEAYCDVLTTKADPLAVAAVKNYDVCLAKSTELGWFSEWSRLCERELGQLEPEQYPTATERHAESDRFAAVIALETPPTL